MSTTASTGTCACRRRRGAGRPGSLRLNGSRPASGPASSAVSYGITGIGKSLVLGAAWAVINYIFVWYMLLPIARGGAPLRTTASSPVLFVAPDWVWVVAFTAFGLAVGACYAFLRPSASSPDDDG
jgi:hypothetical protein